MSPASDKPRPRCAFWLFCALIIVLPGCRDKPLRPVAERPVLFTEIVDPRNAASGRFAGTIQPQYEVALGFRVAGRMAMRHAQIGQQVRKGDLLATLDPGDQQHQLRARQAEVGKARAAWQQARDEHVRYDQLYERGIGSRAHLDQLNSDLRTQDAIRQQTDVALQQANDHVSYTRLTAEFDGLVTGWHAEVGQVIATGQPVVSLARPESREAVVDLPLGLLGAQADNRQINVISQLDEHVSALAKVRQLAPQIDAGTRTQRVRLALQHTPDSFRLGSTVTVEISGAAPNLHELPGSAVLERDGKTQVWVIDPSTSTLSPRSVQVLARNGSNVQLGGELHAGEKVVIAGVNGMQAGQKVRMQREVSL
ncbi:efflux RND transporter periplasmic adaptor subunit [Pseudomonas cannabina]|uniref:RND family efflux transporter MFP subunit n=1 Tax=Pseudomonas cannabina TaxID=86840 RepID=A0A0P9LFI2_PSECA|nr:efflux RND transporter periplasmic adaptor subunit [Pseudomonas cannabina]KAA8716097.1 efflux RND transporter periplasmic adaptor subunit [Pseudomonas cannabina]KPW76264.1 RND family efflux transporter MFP subunit [Pseudomonas cannabina]RMN29121.1 RND family efflux transporter MFP subunit [Pseudomonas cannabina]SDQ79172.1 RND family efflux transporter, MFP subunit [Pseudomonas cannabina]